MAVVHFRTGQVVRYAEVVLRYRHSMGILPAGDAALRRWILQLRSVDEQSGRGRDWAKPEEPGDGYALQELRTAGWPGVPANRFYRHSRRFGCELYSISRQHVRLQLPGQSEQHVQPLELGIRTSASPERP